MENTMNEVATTTGGAVSRIEAPASDSGALIAMIERASRDVTVDIDKMDRLLAMYERMRTQEAEAAFNDAMAAAQAKMEPVRRDASNPQTRSKYATYAALDREVRPAYSEAGFGLSFNTADAKLDNEIRVLCYVTRGGFTRIYHIDMPTDGKGAKGGDVMTKTHATGSGVSYGMRYLVKMIFNIATENDDDGNAAGGRSGYRQDRGGISDEERNNRAAALADAKQREEAEKRGEPVAPHALKPITDEKFGGYAARLAAMIDGCDSTEDAKAWKEKNAEIIGKIGKVRDIDAKTDADRSKKELAAAAYLVIAHAFQRCAARIKEAAGPLDGATNAAQPSTSTAPNGPATQPDSATAASPSNDFADEPPVNPDVFPEPWIKRTPKEYITYCEGWLARSTDNAGIDRRWNDERKIRNGLSAVLTEQQIENLNETKGEAKARHKQATKEATAAANKITDPESFRRGFAATLKDAKTPDECDAFFNRDVEPLAEAMLAPDVDDLLRMLRMRKAELTPED
jgi:hypothetical protein